MLHVHDRNPAATIIGDLAEAPQIADATFDCVVVTQTLHLIFDVERAIATLHRILHAGGVVLATFPGITQLSEDEWSRTWSWAFDSRLVRQLFASRFGEQNVAVEAHGNSLAATAFLHGLATADLTPEQLDAEEPACELLLTVRAVRSSAVRHVAQRLPARRPRAAVLVYHRVGTGSIDPWQLTVDPEIFAGQMETLARDWSPMSLEELVEGFQMRRLPERAVAVTFDDGYADNLEVAAPILLEHAIPATLFVATDLIDAGGPPWWDELASLLLEPARLPLTLTLSSGNGHHWRIPSVSDEERRSASSLNPWDAQPGTRLRAFYEVWLTLRALDAARRRPRSTRSPTGHMRLASPSVFC